MLHPTICLLQDSDLTPSELLLLLALMRQADERQQGSFKQADIAYLAKMDTRTVRRIYNALARKGGVETIGRGPHLTTRYLLHVDRIEKRIHDPSRTGTRIEKRIVDPGYGDNPGSTIQVEATNQDRRSGIGHTSTANPVKNTGQVVESAIRQCQPDTPIREIGIANTLKEERVFREGTPLNENRLTSVWFRFTKVLGREDVYDKAAEEAMKKAESLVGLDAIEKMIGWLPTSESWANIARINGPLFVLSDDDGKGRSPIRCFVAAMPSCRSNEC